MRPSTLASTITRIPTMKNAARYPAASYDRSRNFRNRFPRSAPPPWGRARVGVCATLFPIRVDNRLAVRPGGLQPLLGHGLPDLLEVALELRRGLRHGH